MKMGLGRSSGNSELPKLWGTNKKEHEKNPLTRNITHYGTQQKYESRGAPRLIHIFVDSYKASITQKESSNSQSDTLWNSTEI
jgi:hypothetical protein